MGIQLENTRSGCPFERGEKDESELKLDKEIAD
jgi:hypothetical protein